jgi:hypothetical protein
MSEDRKIIKIWRVFILLVLLHSYQAKGDVEFAGGTGEPNDPYLISTAEQLKSIGTTGYGSKCYKLVADIDLDPNIPGNKILNHSFIDSLSFNGTLDGNGYSISNMVINGSHRTREAGLISILFWPGVVKNIKLRNITILGTGLEVGALVGLNYGIVLQCSVTGNICGESSVGGLVGTNLGNIVTCSAFCNVQGVESLDWEYREGVGGLVGTNYGYISNCCAIGTVTGEESLGGLIGNNDYSNATVSQCFAACEIIAGSNNSIGGLIGKSLGRTTDSFWDIEVSGQKISAGGVGLPTAKLQDPATYLSAGWDLEGETSNGLADFWMISEPNTYPQLTRLAEQYSITKLSGSGTLDDPYEIATAKELVAINDYDINAHYTLVADIDMSGIVWATAPIFVFNGTLNGQGHTISNLTIEGGDYLGLFGKILTNGFITNLTIQNAYITGYKHIGALSGLSYGHMTDCHMTGNVTGVSYVGGLFGAAFEAAISDCTADVVLSGNDYVNEIAGSFIDPYIFY